MNRLLLLLLLPIVLSKKNLESILCFVSDFRVMVTYLPGLTKQE